MHERDIPRNHFTFLVLCGCEEALLELNQLFWSAKSQVLVWCFQRVDSQIFSRKVTYVYWYIDKCVYNLSNSKWTFPNEQVIWIISSDDVKPCMNETQPFVCFMIKKSFFVFLLLPLCPLTFFSQLVRKRRQNSRTWLI